MYNDLTNLYKQNDEEAKMEIHEITHVIHYSVIIYVNNMQNTLFDNGTSAG